MPTNSIKKQQLNKKEIVSNKNVKSEFYKLYNINKFYNLFNCGQVRSEFFAKIAGATKTDVNCSRFNKTSEERTKF